MTFVVRRCLLTFENLDINLLLLFCRSLYDTWLGKQQLGRVQVAEGDRSFLHPCTRRNHRRRRIAGYHSEISFSFDWQREEWEGRLWSCRKGLERVARWSMKGREKERRRWGEEELENDTNWTGSVHPWRTNSMRRDIDRKAGRRRRHPAQVYWGGCWSKRAEVATLTQIFRSTQERWRRMSTWSTMERFLRWWWERCVEHF